MPSSKLTDLLPPERRDLLAREYYFRFGVVVVSLCVALTLAAAALLIPTYVFLTGSASAKETRLAGIRLTLASADEVALSARLAALSNDAAALISLANKPSASKTIGAALLVSRPGVVLSGFVYTPGAGVVPSKLALSGIASTRDALRSYQLALQGASFVRAAELPVSAYAKDTDIDFTISITLAP